MTVDVDSLIKWGKLITMVAAAASAITVWHANVLQEALAPLLRPALVVRINNYRRILCTDKVLSPQAQADFDVAMAEYEELVGRPIGDRSCESL